MSALVRLAAAVTAVLAPLAALAQEAGGRDTTAAPRAGYSWLWIVAGALVVVALFRLLVVRNRTGPPNPPARRP